MNLPELPNNKVILFDGVCNFCNSAINKIIEKDRKNVFVFASLQSEIGQKFLLQIGLTTNPETMVLYEPGIGYSIKRDAALKIAKELGGICSLLGIGNLLPKAVRNHNYDYIAKNRYKWFGKRNVCMIPSTEVKAKFLK